MIILTTIKGLKSKESRTRMNKREELNTRSNKLNLTQKSTTLLMLSTY